MYGGKLRGVVALALVGTVALTAGTANAFLQAWDYSYEANFLPHNDPTLTWGRGVSGTHSESNNGNSGVISIQAGSGSEVTYWLVNNSGDGAGKVDFSSGGTIEWRVDPTGTGGNVSFMHIGDGTYAYTVGMYPGYWAYRDFNQDWEFEPGAGHPVGWDVYRLDLTGGNSAALYLNDALVQNIPGFVGTNPSDPPNNFLVHNQIYWGTDRNFGSGGDSDWDYIRWDTFPLIPEPATAGLLLVGLLLAGRRRSK